MFIFINFFFIPFHCSFYYEFAQTHHTQIETMYGPNLAFHNVSFFFKDFFFQKLQLCQTVIQHYISSIFILQISNWWKLYPFILIENCKNVEDIVTK